MIGVKSPSKVVRPKQLAATLTSTSSPALNGEYFYIRNAQGDIIGLFDKDMNQVVSYIYDSWGKLISINGTLKDSIGVKNPYRYRGYRYDTETGLYYLQSRYYNPEWGRFINADTTDVLKKLGTTNDELTDANLFAYCGNNPVNNSDEGGQFWDLALRFVAAIVAPEAIAAVATVATIGYLGYLGYDYYKRHNITYANNEVDVSGRKNWKSRPLANGESVGKGLPSSDMKKRRINDKNGKPIGEMHEGQPEYKYHPDGTKTPTGRVYPDHYHLKGSPKMHYLP